MELPLTGRCQSGRGWNPLRAGETQIARLKRVIMAKQNYQPPRLTLPVGERDHIEGPSDARMVLVEVRGLPVSLLWGGLPDREEGPEGTWNEAAVHFQKLPHYYLTPASGVGRGNGRGGGRPGEVLGDARFSLRESSIPGRPWSLRQLCEETQPGREAARAGGCSACPSGESSRRLHGWRQERCQRDADVLHWWREIRWLSRIWPLDRGARKGREGLTATRPIAGRVSVGTPASCTCP